MKTWHLETAVAALLLSLTTALFTPNRLTDWVAVLAVLASFGHMSVASRLEEAQGKKEVALVSCVLWLRRYLWAKEGLWIFTFLLSHLYPPLVGSVLFVFYPVWRRYHRGRQEK